MSYTERKNAAKTGNLSTPEHWNDFWTGSQPNIKPSWSKKRILQILDEHIRQKMWVLDAGCGSGFFSKWFNERGCVTVSLDYSKKAIETTQKTTAEKSAAYIMDDLTDPLLPDRTRAKFDIIFSDGLFEHFMPATQNQILSNMAELLKPDGQIITFVPNRWSFWTLIRPLAMPGISEKPLTINRLKNLYERNGCKVIRSGGINVLPVSWSPDRLLGKGFGMLVFCIGSIAGKEE